MSFAEQSFRQDVRGLEMRSNVRQCDATICDVIADEMIADANVLGEIVVAWILGQLDGAFVVDVQHNRTGRCTANAGQQ
jgi:hypothetical protein